MTAQRGSDMLLKIKNADNDYVTMAGLRTKTFRLNSRPIDVTDTGSIDGWKELLPGGGVRSVEISGSGVFRNAESDGIVRSAFFDQSIQDCQCILPSFGVITGDFIISGLSYAGIYQGEATFDLTLMSSGVPLFSGA